MPQGVRELDAPKVREVLERQHVGRLTWLSCGRSRAVPVTYSLCENACVCVNVRTDDTCDGVNTVRLEVDEIQSPLQWSTVVVWGVLEDGATVVAGGSRYRIQLTDVRGFYRTAHD